MGNADAGSVMMLSEDKDEMRNQQISCPGCCAARKRRAADPGPTTVFAAWVPALRSSARALHRVRDTSRSLAPHPVGYPRKILGDDIPIAVRLEIVFLQRTVFRSEERRVGTE